MLGHTCTYGAAQFNRVSQFILTNRTAVVGAMQIFATREGAIALQHPTKTKENNNIQPLIVLLRTRFS